MADEQKTPEVPVVDAQQPTAPEVPAPEVPAPEALKTFTQEDMNRIAAKEAKLAKQAFLAKGEFKTEAEYDEALAIVKAHKENVAKADAEKPELERLKNEVAKILAEKEAESKARAEADAKLTKIERKALLETKGYKGKDLRLAMIEVQELVTEALPFDDALEKYLKENPPADDAPPLPIMTNGHQANDTQPKEHFPFSFQQIREKPQKKE